jgi:nucleotide-binding universal stress UspA family protein
MDKRILFGIDSDLSPITQYVLHEAAGLVEQAAPEVQCTLLNVVPNAQVISTHPGLYAGHIFPLAVPSWQRHQAEDVVYKARLLLQMQGIPFARTEGMVRIGVPADEIVGAAKELQVSLIVIGCHGYSFRHRLRRIVLGSISRRVLRLAPCPVMIVSPPPITSRTTDLVTWYENAIRRYLSEHTDELQVFTPGQLAQQFAPLASKRAGRKEKEAARLALEKLTQQGVLCCHYIQGELRYVND